MWNKPQKDHNYKIFKKYFKRPKRNTNYRNTYFDRKVFKLCKKQPNILCEKLVYQIVYFLINNLTFKCLILYFF